jgi:hypothetical protein
MTHKEIIAGLRAINEGTDTTCLDGQSLRPVDLYGTARQAAVQVLLENWADALDGGASLAGLLHDVNAVRGELAAFERAVRYRFSL